MANIHQDGHSIRNVQVVSSNRVHSTLLCEANKCRIFIQFFFVYQINGFQFFFKKINLRVRFLPLQKVKYLLNKRLDLYEILNLSSQLITKSGHARAPRAHEP